MNKIVVNGVAYDATPVEAAQEGQRTVVVDGVTYAITPAAVPSASVVGNIEKINVNGQLYDIRDVEDVNAISQRIDTILVQLGDVIPVGLALLADKVKRGAITIEMLQGNLQETNKVADNLTTDNTLNPLSARQGKILKGLIDIINGNGEGSTNKKINDAITEFATKLTGNGEIDTFKEVLLWIAEHGNDFSALISRVGVVEINIKNEVTRASSEELRIENALIIRDTNQTQRYNQLQEDLDAEITRATTVEEQLRQRFIELIGNAPGTLDTIHEIASWVENAEDEAVILTQQVISLTKFVEENILAIGIEDVTGDLYIVTGAETNYKDVAVDEVTGEISLGMDIN